MSAWNGNCTAPANIVVKLLEALARPDLFTGQAKRYEAFKIGLSDKVDVRVRRTHSTKSNDRSPPDLVA